MRPGNAIVAAVTRPTWPLILLASFMGLLVLVSAIAFFSVYGQWSQRHSGYAKWVLTEQPAACETVKAICEATTPKVLDDPDPAAREMILRLMDRFKEVERCAIALAKKRQIECYESDPGGLADNLWAFVVDKDLVQIALLLWMALLVLTAALRAVLNEPHLGWQRIALLLPLLVGPIAGVVVFQGWNMNPAGIVFFSICAMIAALVVPILLKRTYGWVHEGFGDPGDKPAVPPPKALTLNPTNAIRLTPKLAFRILAGPAALAVCVAVLAYGSDKAISSLVSSIVQVVGVVGLVALIRWIYSLRSKDKK